MTRRPTVPAILSGTIPAVAPESKRTHGGRDGRPADELTTPAPTYGWLRRTCVNTWWLAPVAFLIAVAPAFVWRTWWAWVMLAVIAAWWVFAQTAANPDMARETDRDAFRWAALMTGVLAVLCGLIIGGVLWVGGWE